MKRASYFFRSYEPCSMLHYPCTSRPGCWRSHGAWGCPCPGASWTLVYTYCPPEAPSQEWVSECVLLLFILTWQEERHCLWKAAAERHCLSVAAAPMAPLPAPLDPIGPYINKAQGVLDVQCISAPSLTILNTQAPPILNNTPPLCKYSMLTTCQDSGL